MTRAIVAVLVTLGLVGSISAPSLAHRSSPRSTVKMPSEKPFSPKAFWDQQQEKSKGR